MDDLKSAINDAYNGRFSVDVKNNGVLELCNNDIAYDVLPVINIKVDYFMGDGTISNPYVISENMEEE